MTISPVGANSIESISPDSGASPASGFAILLAGAQAEAVEPDDANAVAADTGDDEAAPADPGADGANDVDPCPGKPETPKADEVTPPPVDDAGLLAGLATLALAAAPPAAPVAPLVDASDTTTGRFVAPITEATISNTTVSNTTVSNTSVPVTYAPTDSSTDSPAPTANDLPDDIIATVDLTQALDPTAADADPVTAPEPDGLTASEISDAVDAILASAIDALPADADPEAVAAPAEDAPARPDTRLGLGDALTSTRAESTTSTAPALPRANVVAPAAINDAAAVDTSAHARPAASSALAPNTDTSAASTAMVVNPLPAPSGPAATTPVEQINPGHAPAPPAAEQLVSVLTPLRATGNGSYTLHLELKPAELGRVELRVDMKDGVLHASIHSEREGSAQLLRDALTELRDRLEGANVRTGDLSVSDGSVGAREHNGRNAPGRSGPNSPADANTEDPTAAPAAGDLAGLDPDGTSLLDVRV